MASGLWKNKYTILKKLNDRNSVFVVKDIEDDSLWVGKIIEIESVGIYSRLLNKRHKNIAYIREMFTTDEGAVVIEEYAEGCSITSELEKGRLFTASEVKDITMQLCDGAEFLHNMGIVHRDISSNNVIIDSHNNVKLVDMGIARFMDPYKNTDTYLMGTAGYAPPEQFGFRQTDKRSDIFSIGVLMNVMLTGEFPNEHLYKGIPRLEKIIMRSVEIEPQRRYKNTDRLKKALFTMPTEKDNVFMSLIKEIPITRTFSTPKIILCACIYVLILSFALLVNVLFLFEGRFVDIIGFDIWIITGMFFPCLLAGNYLYYIDRIPFIRILPRSVRDIICILLGICLAVLSFTIFYILYVDLGIGG